MDNDLLNQFVNESCEHLATIEADLLTIEEGGADINEQLVNKVFRAAHSVKGGGGFFGLSKVKELAHKAETLLDLLRSRKRTPNAEIINLLLISFDKLREMLNDAANSDQVDIADLVASLTELASSGLPLDQKAMFKAPPVFDSPPALQEPEPEPEPLPAIPLSIPPISQPPLVEKPAEPSMTPPAGSTSAAEISTPADETLRVHVGLLETLMNLAGELVLSRNQLRTAVTQNNPQTLSAAEQRIDQVTSELQDVIMQTRLQPMGNVFAKFPRVVRDLARTLGKDIELEIQGKEVALDRSLIEGLSDPLTHMVRNAVDHGIETIDERIRAGKNPVGQLRIEARHEAGQVVVEIADDGKGIDPQQVVAVAIARQLISAEKAQGLSNRDQQALIFLPGLSTANQISDVSGRGVGMDVVKTNLDRLGGQIEILSEPGKGSLFRIKLPLTLAIIPSLIVSMENERFAIPQANIEELLRLRAEEVQRRIEVVGDAEVLLLRDRMLPLARFDQVLGIIPTYVDLATGLRETDQRSRLADRRSPRYSLLGEPLAVNHQPPAEPRHPGGRRERPTSALEIAVVTTGSMSYGLVVGGFHDTEEIVVKPLGRRLKHLREYSGATILGDGSVALILDISGVAARAGLTSVVGSLRALELAAQAETARLQDLHSLLLFHNAPDEPCAAPLDIVQRIERITPSRVERLGGQRTMQYRGGSLPLVTLADVGDVHPIEDAQEQAVLVASIHGREVGLLVAMPVDVVETRLIIDPITHRQKGIAGSALINDCTTLIVDLHDLVDLTHPDWKPAGAERSVVTVGSATVLLAEDSDFFRTQIKRYLEEDGFTVLDATDGEAAWELLLRKLQQVQVVVTDIEMPRLTGLGLASRIRADSRTAHLPIIAVTSLASEEDMAKGKAIGITEYQIKLDRDQLLASVHACAAA
ncbi:MAG: chemotaxis protein CheW [Candidatus Contendobacter sp.]|nr:chemotaxis protein CheW [Candidatus Contendobacter sp.]